MVTDDELRQIMPNCPTARRAAYLPYIQQAMEEFTITSYLREAAFLAQLAHESGELRYMEELASGAAYEGRKDLGNTQPGDGKLYKGRGPIQLTGRANYKKYGDLLGVDLINNPAIAATPEVGFRIAGQFWKLNGLNELADKQQFETITRRINGGLNGQPDRLKYYAQAKQILNKDDGTTSYTPATPVAESVPITPSVDSTSVTSSTPVGAPAQPVTPGQSAPYPGAPLRAGSQGSAVRTVQQRLNDLGANIAVDGKFGNGTRQALIVFQNKNGLTADGVVGPATWAALWSQVT